MKREKFFVAIIAFNIAVLGLSASFYHLLACKAPELSVNNLNTSASTGSSKKFGPVMEIVLPAAKTDEPELLNLETGRLVPEKPYEHFNFRVDAIMAWIRSNGLDISCKVWSTGAACVTYDMNIVAVEGKSREEMKADELLANPAIARRSHSPRRLLVLERNRPNTYIFCTGDGTFGMLRIVGLSEQERGVRIRYKLINPVKQPT